MPIIDEYDYLTYSNGIVTIVRKHGPSDSPSDSKTTSNLNVNGKELPTQQILSLLSPLSPEDQKRTLLLVKKKLIKDLEKQMDSLKENLEILKRD